MKKYPLKFVPILQDKIWGGDKLKTLLGKETHLTRVGESWEISSVNNAISVVANGVYKGKTLVELIQQHQGDFVGNQVYASFGNTFPLLIKFIDAAENLSIQLHPEDALAQARHQSFGKTEMWYVVDAEENAQLNVGFSKEMTPETFQEAITNNQIIEVCNFENVQAGDSYFIKAGLVHAIGAGCLIAEIQQTSDITYRIYDWDRVDAKGNCRELHTELAMDALDYTANTNVKCKFDKIKNAPNQIASCNYFTTNYIKVNNLFIRELVSIDSFVVYICVKGQGIIVLNEVVENIQQGQTILIPAGVKQVEIKAKEVELLEVYIK